jgi:hypothetical protein
LRRRLHVDGTREDTGPADCRGIRRAARPGASRGARSSPSDRWPKVLAKVAEYLDAGTTVVIVLDDQRRLAHVYRADGTTRVLGADEELTIPDLLGDFHVRAGRFFE